MPDTRDKPAFDLPGIVPWGRRFSEYAAFFGIGDPRELGPVLDIGAGPSSFAAEAHALGFPVVAADPLYGLPAEDITHRFEETVGAVRAGLRRAAYRFNWAHYGSEENVLRLRREALALFAADYEAGKRDGRYVEAALPVLPFPDGAFSLALVSHLLFLYGDRLDFRFHVASLKELLRVAEEVRVFPLLNLDGLPSSHLPGAMKALRAEGHEAELVEVPFEFQRGATRMLRLRRR